MTKAILIIGAGGHAAVLADVLQQLGQTITAIVAPQRPEPRAVFAGITWLNSDQDILRLAPEQVLLVNGIGSLPGHNRRAIVQQDMIDAGYTFATVIAPTAIVSPYASIAEGVQIMPGAIVNVGAMVGPGSIINSGAIVEHDCQIGALNHLAPGAVLCGAVRTGPGVHVGTGAVVIQNVSIGANTVIAANATVRQDLPADSTLYGAQSCLKGEN